MKKMIAAMLLGMSLMVSVTGCGTESTESKTEQSSNDTQKAETEKQESEKEEESTSSDVAPVSAFEYELTDDGNARIIDYNALNEYKEVVFPEEIDGYKVTELGHVDEGSASNVVMGVLSNDEKVEKVTIPDTVEVIGPNVFTNCTNLKEVNLGNGVKEIQIAAFSNTAIEEIVLPDSVEKLQIGALGAYSLKSVTVTANLTTIEKGSFVVGGDLVMYGPAGCAAESYAAEEGYSYVVE